MTAAESTRITPERVLAAYKTTHATPIRGSWGLDFGGNEPCSLCALSAVAVAEDRMKLVDIQRIQNQRDTGESLFAALGLDDDYADGFTTGFDTRSQYLFANTSIGVDDGIACAKAVFGE